MEPEEVFTVKEAARFLKLGQRKMYELITTGEIPCKRVGRSIRILREDLIDYMKGIPRANSVKKKA